MGRDITIFGLKYKQLKKLTSEIQNNEDFLVLFDQYKNNYNSVNINKLVEKLNFKPEKISIDEVCCLVWTYLDLMELNKSKTEFSNYLIKKKRLAEFGIEYYIEINTTNPSCTFMEIFYDTIEILNLKWDEKEDNCFKLNPLTLDQILQKMVLITTFFNNQDSEYIYSEIDYDIEEFYKIELEKLYQDQFKNRLDNIEYYTRKWGTDYFSFSYLCLKFIKSRRKIFDFDTFIMIDSY